LLEFRPWLTGRGHLVEPLAGADAEHDASREHRAHGAERLGDDGRMVAKRRRQHAGPHDHARRFGAQCAEPRQRERRMAVDVLPRLKVVADEDRVEADFLGKAREAQQLARRELLRRGLVSELDHRTSPWLAPVDADAVVPVVEIYRLAANQQPAKARKRPCISDLPCLSATSVAMARSCANSLRSRRPKVTMA